MPRTARIAPKEYTYHILTRGNNRQDIFKNESDYEKYLEVLQRYKERYGFKLYHYRDCASGPYGTQCTVGSVSRLAG
ncbi:MAG: transposase [Deltaproteobacteria bacterium]|nr:transposase [Deltaproteobacteria bacterium]